MIVEMEIDANRNMSKNTKELKNKTQFEQQHLQSRAKKLSLLGKESENQGDSGKGWKRGYSDSGYTWNSDVHLKSDFKKFTFPEFQKSSKMAKVCDEKSWLP